MNVIFISPNFPSHFYLFCQRLKERGVQVLGIGDASYEALSDSCRNALTDYRAVSSLEHYDEVYRAAAELIFRYGRIDYVASENEYWLPLEAKLREDFNVRNGIRPAVLRAMNHKSEMKKAYAAAGIPAARWTLPKSEQEAIKFAERIGYPVIVKPDHGVGASDTHKLHNTAELRSWWAKRDSSVEYIEEECVNGHVETFDGITDSGRNVLFAASQSLPVSLMDAVNEDTDVVSFCQAPDESLRSAGERLLRQFDTRNLFFHFEFFRLDKDQEGLGKKGDIVGLEVNMRAPGGRIPDKMNYAYDTDVYTIWADSLIYDKCFMNSSFRRYVTHVGRKDSIRHRHSREEIRARYGTDIIEEMDVDPALADEMGNYAFLLRADSLERREEQVRYILERED